jgi:hypothetical protein
LEAENAGRNRPMAHGLHHILANAKVRYASIVVENCRRISIRVCFYSGNGIKNLLESAITERKRLVPSELQLEIFVVEQTSQMRSSLAIHSS